MGVSGVWGGEKAGWAGAPGGVGAATGRDGHGRASSWPTSAALLKPALKPLLRTPLAPHLPQTCSGSASCCWRPRGAYWWAARSGCGRWPAPRRWRSCGESRCASARRRRFAPPPRALRSPSLCTAPALHRQGLRRGPGSVDTPAPSSELLSCPSPAMLANVRRLLRRRPSRSSRATSGQGRARAGAASPGPGPADRDRARCTRALAAPGIHARGREARAGAGAHGVEAHGAPGAAGAGVAARAGRGESGGCGGAAGGAGAAHVAARG